MKNVGLLLTKNEPAILAETLRANTGYIKEIYALFGGDKETEEILGNCDQVKMFIDEQDVSPATGSSLSATHPMESSINDGIRQVLLEEILEECNFGDWVTLMHGDEVFYHDPNAAAALASLTGYNTVIWFAPHFFLTKEDMLNWDHLKNQPLEERITWYATNEYPWTECRQFQLQPGMHYNLHAHSRVAPFSDSIRIMPTCPIYKHYKMWTPDPTVYELSYSEKYGRVVSKEKGKWGVIPWEIRDYDDCFVELYPGYTQRHKFEGDFGQFEIHFNEMCCQLNNYLAEKDLELHDIIQTP